MMAVAKELQKNISSIMMRLQLKLDFEAYRKCVSAEQDETCVSHVVAIPTRT